MLFGLSLGFSLGILLVEIQLFLLLLFRVAGFAATVHLHEDIGEKWEQMDANEDAEDGHEGEADETAHLWLRHEVAEAHHKVEHHECGDLIYRLHVVCPF